MTEVTELKPKRGFKFNRGQLCIPYAVFLALFVVFPLLVIVYYAFTLKDGTFSVSNFVWFFKTPEMRENFLTSIEIGALTTVFCLILGYPVAYVLSRIKSHRRGILLMLFVMPTCINFVLRAMAMKELLGIVGLFGKYHFLNTVIGMVYDYLPFMILPLYSVLIKMDKSLEEAAADLGAGKVKIFTSVTLPLSVSGILSGITMVFLPSMTCYVISYTYSNGKIKIIGDSIERFFKQNDINGASVIALILLVIMLAVTLISGGFNKNDEMRGLDL